METGSETSDTRGVSSPMEPSVGVSPESPAKRLRHPIAICSLVLVLVGKELVFCHQAQRGVESPATRYEVSTFISAMAVVMTDRLMLLSCTEYQEIV